MRRKARYCEYPECDNHKVESINKSLKTCSRCNLVHYCYVGHQRLHWSVHKMICQKI